MSDANAAAPIPIPAPAPIPVPAPAPAATTIVVQPGVPITLQLTVGAVVIKATINFNMSAAGGVSFSVDTKTMTADSSVKL